VHRIAALRHVVSYGDNNLMQRLRICMTARLRAPEREEFAQEICQSDFRLSGKQAAF
jgi:hypothetical protein